MSILKNKVALITGGVSGIGEAAVKVFAKEGARIVIADIKENGNNLLRVIQELGSEGIYIQTDISDPGSVSDLVENAVNHFGKLDCAFNNAGIEGQQAETTECTNENWDKVIKINLTGLWYCMKYELKQMLKQGSGAIVNTSSAAGLVGFTQLPAYVASKHGVNGLTKASALEYAQKGIRINAVCPGVIHTAMVDRVTHKDPIKVKQYVDMEPIGRMGTTKEIADTAAWLCSDLASFITGQAIAVDGGLTSR
ncbi:MAG TPA: SDR family oxidoreductase [Chitinispirillaceae bacterium]|nr:SDR family oxidoreductase [Chitinispirillaceae bacterium]